MGKTTIEMAREIRTKGLQNQAGGPVTYAAVAARGQAAPSIQYTQPTMPKDEGVYSGIGENLEVFIPFSQSIVGISIICVQSAVSSTMQCFWSPDILLQYESFLSLQRASVRSPHMRVSTGSISSSTPVSRSITRTHQSSRLSARSARLFDSGSEMSLA
jgi:hypothetical protein